MKNWLTLIAVAIIVYGVLWGLLIYGYGNFILIDDIVPDASISIEEWMETFYKAGGLSVLAAFACNIGWYCVGASYCGEGAIRFKYLMFLFVASLSSLASAIFIIEKLQTTELLPYFLVFIIGPVGYYVVTLICSPSTVRYIPPFSEKILSKYSL